MLPGAPKSLVLTSPSGGSHYYSTTNRITSSLQGADFALKIPLVEFPAQRELRRESN